MAESSALCSSPFPPFPTFSRSKRSPSSTKRPTCPSFTTKPPLTVRCSAKNSKGGGGGYLFGDDSFGFYPWESHSASSADGDGSIQWVQEDTVTLFTTDGLIRIGGSMVPRQITSLEKQVRSKNSQRLQRHESDYMDPNQELCLGALFDIAATNGLDLGRRLCIFGFCRSIEMLSDVVEDTVLEFGGEVLAAKKASTGGLQERLTMSVAVPLLWGVPPASDTLHLAVRSGGGIVDKIYWQWDFL